LGQPDGQFCVLHLGPFFQLANGRGRGRWKGASSRPGFTIVELLVIIAIISLLVGMLLPSLAKAKARSQRIACVSNLHQVGLGFRVWSDDHDGFFPWWLPEEEEGTRAQKEAWRHYAIAADDLLTPRILRCPADTTSLTASDFSDHAPNGFARLGNKALSYFLAAEANETLPAHHLAGDRNLEGQEGRTCGVADLIDCVTMLFPNNSGWDYTIHGFAGNIALVDGSVQELNGLALNAFLEQTGDTNFTNCILKP
jgi:prepilin-type processing-associated H-X9-DG protein